MDRVTLAGGMAILAGLLMNASAFATGYWNLPSSFCQCAGYGCGAGYHAPLVLGPISCEGWLAPNEVRLPFSPQASYGAYGCRHCRSGGYPFDAPTMLDPRASPPAEALQIPTPTPTASRVPLR